MDINQINDLVAEGIQLTRLWNNPESTGRYYHNGKHSQMAHDYFFEIAVKAYLNQRISYDEILLGRLAMAWHDVIQGQGSTQNETKSADLLAKDMVRYAFSPDQINQARELILGTITSFDEQGYMHQRAELIATPLALLVADADLCSLGAPAPKFVLMSQRLIMEFAGKTDLSPEEWQKGWAGQVKFMTGRTFLTPEANERWGLRLAQNFELAKTLAQ